MQITINDKSHEVADSLTITELLKHLELDVRQVAVEVNRQLVPRGSHAEHHLKPGDTLEVVTLVGGG